MQYRIVIVCFVITLSCIAQHTTAQAFVDSTTASTVKAIEDIPQKSVDYLDKKYQKLSAKVQSETEKTLSNIQKQEAKLQQKLQGIDSTKAKKLFSGTQEKYKTLQDKISNPVNTQKIQQFQDYIPRLDSITTAFNFLNSSQLNSSVVSDKLTSVTGVTDHLNELQTRLQQASDVKTFIKEREEQLKTALENTALAKDVLKINKEVYYYQQQFEAYKALLKQPDKMFEKAMELVRDLPAFKSFWEKNSYLAQLFPASPNAGTPEALAGLQTRVQLQQQINQTFVGSGISPQQYVQQQFQSAQAQLSQLKNKLNQLGGGSSDMAMPDFKPNSQKTKPFLKRFEYGLNLQNTRGTSILPAMTDIALNLGYKFSDKSVAGIGGGYKLGWGSGINHIQFSSQGVALRSYVDLKIRGGIWATGGFEYNYLQAFSDFETIKNLDVWQRSALAGITKKYKVGKRTTNFQLLYDFLAERQVPRGQSLKFRMGWTF
jgi:hypothetical protein